MRAGSNICKMLSKRWQQSISILGLVCLSWGSLAESFFLVTHWQPNWRQRQDVETCTSGNYRFPSNAAQLTIWFGDNSLDFWNQSAVSKYHILKPWFGLDNYQGKVPSTLRDCHKMLNNNIGNLRWNYLLEPLIVGQGSKQSRNSKGRQNWETENTTTSNNYCSRISILFF